MEYLLKKNVFLLKIYGTKLNTDIIFKNLAYIYMLDVVFELDF